jgi:chemotaxis protein methyltransferase CheR
MITTPLPADVDRFRSMVARRLGLRFDDAKLAWLGDVLRRRIEAGPRGGALYQALLDAEPGTPPPDWAAASGAAPVAAALGAEEARELGALAEELTVGETYFFRHNDQLRALHEDVVLGQLAPRAAPRRLRILSAGCASGDEAYSLAMLLHGLRADPGWDLSIHAIDLNPAAVERARRGRYSEWHLRETPPAMQERWFRGDGRELVLDDSIRAAVSFEVRNLGADDALFWRPGAHDVVFCRNVLMYLTPQAAQAAVAHITRSLVPGGHLFLGHAETLRGLSQDYDLCHTQGAFYYRRKPQLHAWPPDAAGSPLAALVADPEVTAAVDGADNWVEAIGRAAERVRALTAQPGSASARGHAGTRDRPQLDQAMALFRRERFAEALGLMQALPDEAARDPDALLLHAVLLVHRGDFDAAGSACHQLLAQDGLNAGAHYVLALCREGMGDQAGAAEHDQAAAYLDPGFAMPRLHLGLLARRAGDAAAARRELEQALTLLACEDASRVLLFGGGFHRDTLLALCRAELQACGRAA